MNLPVAFTDALRLQFPSRADHIIKTIQDGAPPVSIRWNRTKAPQSKHLTPVAWCSDGFYLEERPLFTADPLFHAGAYYVQEASSMMLEHIFRCIKPPHPVHVLDVCAAPGGKSTHLASLLTSDDLLVSNEVIQTRAITLKENIIKWGHPSCVVTRNDPQDFKNVPDFFDIAWVDAPCSGEGLFRRDHNSIKEWSSENVQLCSARQQRILHDVWSSVRKGGIIIYSTCTFNTLENEHIISSLLEQGLAETISIPMDEAWGFVPSSTVPTLWKALPDKVKGEGFSFCVLRKLVDLPEIDFKKSKGTPYQRHVWKQLPFDTQILATEVVPIQLRGEWYGIHEAHLGSLSRLTVSLSVIHAGVPLGEAKGTDWRPAHGLAMSNVLRPDAYPSIDLTLDEAIRFLKRESLPWSGTLKDTHLMRFHSIPLGFAKPAGNRLNNLYPMDWRITMQLPQPIPSPFYL